MAVHINNGSYFSAIRNELSKYIISHYFNFKTVIASNFDIKKHTSNRM